MFPTTILAADTVRCMTCAWMSFGLLKCPCFPHATMQSSRDTSLESYIQEQALIAFMQVLAVASKSTKNLEFNAINIHVHVACTN